jgi:long-subunit fatty acid transport protein
VAYTLTKSMILRSGVCFDSPPTRDDVRSTHIPASSDGGRRALDVG